jgi:hypothetical protein
VIRKFAWWAFIAFIIFYVVTQPQSAGHLVHSLVSGFKSAGNSAATLVNTIGHG